MVTKFLCSAETSKAISSAAPTSFRAEPSTSLTATSAAWRTASSDGDASTTPRASSAADSRSTWRACVNSSKRPGCSSPATRTGRASRPSPPRRRRARLAEHRRALNAGESDFRRHDRGARDCSWTFEDWSTSPTGSRRSELPRRYDTRFFVALAPSDQVATHDAGETVADSVGATRGRARRARPRRVRDDAARPFATCRRSPTCMRDRGGARTTPDHSRRSPASSPRSSIATESSSYESHLTRDLANFASRSPCRPGVFNQRDPSLPWKQGFQKELPSR